jgi:hypothetical protein
MTKAELIVKGKTLGLDLSNSLLKGEMEKIIAKAEKNNKAKASSNRKIGER